LEVSEMKAFAILVTAVLVLTMVAEALSAAASQGLLANHAAAHPELTTHLSRPLQLGLNTVSTFTPEATPTTDGNMLGPPGIDVVDLAVGSDNQTAYAVTGTTAGVGFYKTTDLGVSWGRLPYLSSINTSITGVAVAPDDPTVVGIIADGNEVYLSSNGGTTWSDLTPVSDLAAGTAAAMLKTIDVSRSVGGVRTIAVGGVSTTGSAGLWYFEVGALVTAWVDATASTNWTRSYFGTSNATESLKFSPNWAADRTMTVVTTNRTGEVTLQMANFVSKSWNSSTYGSAWGSGVIVETGLTGQVLAASLASPSTYLGADPESRIVFFGLATADATKPGGIFRFNDIANTIIATGKIRSVDYCPTGDKLVAGDYPGLFL
jgi:hypothetical protein